MSIISIFSILLAVFVLSSAVSAADIDNVTVPVPTNVEETVISEDIIINEGTFSDLVSEIGKGGNITLNKDVYVYDEEDFIKIKTPGVIDGNGAVIDMANSNVLVFKVIVDGVVIKNLNFVNVNSTGYGGGAINFGYSGVVDNCNFINCRAYQGSAVYMQSGIVQNCNIINNTNAAAAVFINEGSLKNCNFIGNSAFEGAAVGINHGSIENCNFINNTAERDGGAVWMGDGDINNCNFTNNAAERDGGAVWMDIGGIDNCNFDNNQAYNNGGAVYADHNAALTNSTFNNNKGIFGGALWIKMANIDACNFENNCGLGNGGAVCMGIGTVENSNFNGDNAYAQGDAIFANEKYFVKNCDFSNIDSERAIGSCKNGIIEDCTFDDADNNVDIAIIDDGHIAEIKD